MTNENQGSFFYKIESMSNNDVNEVTEFTNIYFVGDEPITKSLNITKTDASPTTEEQPSMIQNCIRAGTSLKAIDKDGKIIGVSLNDVVSRDHAEKILAIDQDSKGALVLKYLSFVEEQANVFKRFPKISRLLEINIIAVSQHWRQKGVATELVNRCRKVAVDHGCELILMHCTSAYSEKLAKKLGFECLYSQKYVDFVQDNGTPYFVPEAPHYGSAIYIQWA